MESNLCRFSYMCIFFSSNWEHHRYSFIFFFHYVIFLIDKYSYISLLDEDIMTLIVILIFSIISHCLAESNYFYYLIINFTILLFLEWSVYVYTGKERFSGTDANVYIRLFNPKGESTSEAQLTHYNWMPDYNEIPFRNLFEVGARERFEIKTEYIGNVSKIHVRF